MNNEKEIIENFLNHFKDMKPLDEEYAKILNDNFWDLVETDKPNNEL